MSKVKLETEIQKDIKDKISDILPGSIVLKNDPNQLQGVPDLSVLWEGKWAFLEVKQKEDSPHRPNQDYYIKKADYMSYGRFISGETEEEVLEELFLFMNE